MGAHLKARTAAGIIQGSPKQESEHEHIMEAEQLNALSAKLADLDARTLDLRRYL